MNKKRLIFVFLLLVACLYFLFWHERSSKSYLLHQGVVFGTTYHITYESPDGTSLDSVILNELQIFDNSLSMFNEHSVISAVNRNDTSVVLDTLFVRVFKKAREVSTATHGAFDMTVAPLVNVWGFGFKKNEAVTSQVIDSIMPFIGYTKIKLVGNQIEKADSRMMLDASAIAKGYACDVLAQALVRQGVRNYIVEIGGEVALNGKNAKGKAWRVGINKPIEDSTSLVSEIQDVVELTHGGMATSGNYRNFYVKNGKKYSHTINPQTGYPVQHSLLSATIIAPDCMTADAYATACMVMGLDESLKLCRERADIEGYFIYADHDSIKVVRSEGFPLPVSR